MKLLPTIAALALLVTTAAPAFAWDHDITVPCGQQVKVPFNKLKNTYEIRWEGKNKQAATLVVFTDKLHLEQDGHAERYHIKGSCPGGDTLRFTRHDRDIDIHDGSRGKKA